MRHRDERPRFLTLRIAQTQPSKQSYENTQFSARIIMHPSNQKLHIYTNKAAYLYKNRARRIFSARFEPQREGSEEKFQGSSKKFQALDFFGGRLEVITRCERRAFFDLSRFYFDLPCSNKKPSEFNIRRVY